MPHWREFEQLAAQIYQELLPHAQVVHDDRIVGSESGVGRQIDVSIRYSIDDYPLLTIIQAKDYGRPADVDDVGCLSAVLRDIRANKGILICRGGFTKGAKSYARNLGIDLCNIHDAQRRRWSLEISFPILWVDLLPVLQPHIEVHLEAGDSLSRDPREWVISGDGGQTRVDLFGTFMRAWNEGKLPREVGPQHYVSPSGNERYELLVASADGQAQWRFIDRLDLSYQVTRKAWLGSFSPEECRGILNYEQGTFTPTYLSIGTIPMRRDESWTEVDDPEALAVSIPGALITTEGFQIQMAGAELESLSLTRISE